MLHFCRYLLAAIRSTINGANFSGINITGGQVSINAKVSQNTNLPPSVVPSKPGKSVLSLDIVYSHGLVLCMYIYIYMTVSLGSAETTIAGPSFSGITISGTNVQLDASVQENINLKSSDDLSSGTSHDKGILNYY